MAKVVYASLKGLNPERKTRGVTTKRMRDADGQFVTIHTVDANSQTFVQDIGYVFRQNVRKARRRQAKALNASGSAPAND